MARGELDQSHLQGRLCPRFCLVTSPAQGVCSPALPGAPGWPACTASSSADAGRAGLLDLANCWLEFLQLESAYQGGSMDQSFCGALGCPGLPGAERMPSLSSSKPRKALWVSSGWSSWLPVSLSEGLPLLCPGPCLACWWSEWRCPTSGSECFRPLWGHARAHSVPSLQSPAPAQPQLPVTVSLPHEHRLHGLSSFPCLSSPLQVTSRIDCSHSEPCPGVDCGRHPV